MARRGRARRTLGRCCSLRAQRRLRSALRGRWRLRKWTDAPFGPAIGPAANTGTFDLRRRPVEQRDVFALVPEPAGRKHRALPRFSPPSLRCGVRYARRKCPGAARRPARSASAKLRLGAITASASASPACMIRARHWKSAGSRPCRTARHQVATQECATATTGTRIHRAPRKRWRMQMHDYQRGSLEQWRPVPPLRTRSRPAFAPSSRAASRSRPCASRISRRLAAPAPPSEAGRARR